MSQLVHYAAVTPDVVQEARCVLLFVKASSFHLSLIQFLVPDSELTEQDDDTPLSHFSGDH